VCVWASEVENCIHLERLFPETMHLVRKAMHSARLFPEGMHSALFPEVMHSAREPFIQLDAFS
jgi:hypothetical protein